MKPAICSVCGKSSLEESSGQKGDWVEFKNYKFENTSSLSHPIGLEYFCSDHLASALEFINKNSDVAIDDLKMQFPYMQPTPDNDNHKTSWWKRLMRS